MRGFIGWLLLVATLGGLAFVAAPIVAEPVIAGAVRAALPLGSGPVEVDVSVDTLGLLRGSVDRIRLTGTDLEATDASIGSLDVTADGIAIGDRSFDSMQGSLAGVVLRRPGGVRVAIEEITLTGAASAADVDARLKPETVVELAGSALAGAGLNAEGIELTDGGLRVSVLGQQANVAIGVVDGAVVVAGSVAGGSIVLFKPEPGEPWRITSVSVSPAGMDVHAVLDVAAALRAR